MSQRFQSKRTPESDTRINGADRIERGLQKNHQRKWGYVIYRCDYESDVDWREFLKRILYKVRFSLECYNGLDMMDRFDITTFEDKDSLNGASKSAVRKIFNEWTSNVVEAEQGTTNRGTAQRYRYCIHVDADVLKSVVDDAVAPPEPEGRDPGPVNLISKDWEPDPADPMAEGEEPVEGSDRHDVGWMKVAYQSVMVSFYVYLEGCTAWYREYRRPPKIARG